MRAGAGDIADLAADRVASGRQQAPGADHVVRECVPQDDGADLVEAAHDELPQPAIACLGIGTFRSRRALPVDRLGRLAAHAFAPPGDRRRVAQLRCVPLARRVARRRHRHIRGHAGRRQRRDVVQFGVAAISKMLARPLPVVCAEGGAHRRQPAHVGAAGIDRHAGDGAAHGVGGELHIVSWPEGIRPGTAS